MIRSSMETSVQVLGSGSDNVPAPIEKQIDIQSLASKLSSLLPGDRQIERRTHKLAWHLSKGRRVRCDWDNVSLSELTPAENRMYTITRLRHPPRKAEDPGSTAQPRPRERDTLNVSDDTGSESFW